jgi:hypothetical protein
MIMTNEEHVEELLHEASAFGLRQEVIDTARQIREEDPSIDSVTSYELAFREWVK